MLWATIIRWRATNKDGSLVDKTNLPEAKLCFKKVISLDPDHKKAHYNLAKILVSENNHNLAKTHLLKALKIDVEYSKAHHLIAIIYEISPILN